MPGETARASTVSVAKYSGKTPSLSQKDVSRNPRVGQDRNLGMGLATPIWVDLDRMTSIGLAHRLTVFQVEDRTDSEFLEGL